MSNHNKSLNKANNKNIDLTNNNKQVICFTTKYI